MQTPPESNYNRPDMGNYPSAPYQTDKVIGIIIMVLAICGAILSGIVVLGGGVLAAAGGAAATNANTDAAKAAGMGGGLLMILGVVMLISCLVSLAVGYGIMKSLRWGFMLGAVVYGIQVILNIFSLARGGTAVIGLVIAIALLVYCVMRLTGKTGPTPL